MRAVGIIFPLIACTSLAWQPPPLHRQRPAHSTRIGARLTAVKLVEAPEPLKWTEAPDNTHKWEGYTVNYIAAGPEAGPPMLLIHGFGASGFQCAR